MSEELNIPLYFFGLYPSSTLTEGRALVGTRWGGDLQFLTISQESLKVSIKNELKVLIKIESLLISQSEIIYESKIYSAKRNRFSLEHNKPAQKINSFARTSLTTEPWEAGD